MRKDNPRTHNYRVLEPTASPDNHDDCPDERQDTQKTHPRHATDARTRDRTPHTPRLGDRCDRELPNFSDPIHAHPDDEGVELLAHDGILLVEAADDLRTVTDGGESEADDPAHTAPHTHLTTIDGRTGALLESLETADLETADLEAAERRLARRHLREIRARVEALSVVFGCLEVVTARLDRDDLGECPEEHRDATDGTTIPMVRRRGPDVTTDLGPDPAAFEREDSSREEGRDE